MIGIIDGDGTVAVEYQYDAWGKEISHTTAGDDGSTLYNYNALKYRGYYYDAETGFYYVSSRYYDPEIGRFINADTIDLVLASQTTLTDKNLYAYCDNNPIVRRDESGAIWETVFDVISLAASIAEVIDNPKDVWAWAGLVGDAIDLIPIVTGAGEVVRSLKAVNKIDDISDTIGITNKVSNTVDDTKIIAEKITGYTKHGLEQAIGRNGIGVAPNAILDAVRNPKKTVSKIDDLGRPSTQYRGVKATVVLNPAGKIVSCWAKSSKYGRIK